MLRPALALRLGDLEYREQVRALRLKRTQLPAMDRLEVVMPKGVRLDARPGDECILALGTEDEADTYVFTGLVAGVVHTGEMVRVAAAGPGALLARYRPVDAFEQLTIGEVMEQLCREAGIDAVVENGGMKLPLFALDGRTTALQAIARLAVLMGAGGAFDGRGMLHVAEAGGPNEELALRWRREVIGVSLGTEAGPASDVIVIGEGAGSPSSPKTRWFTTDFLGGGVPTVEPGARRRVEAILRDIGDTEAAAEGFARRAAARSRPVRIDTWLMPALAPGLRIEIADLPRPLDLDDCRVVQSVSTIDAGRGVAETRVWAHGRPAEGGGLMGTALGAAGGLL